MSQLKIKNGNSWEAIPAGGVGVPSGGTQGQYLVKSSSTDYATEWASHETGITLLWTNSNTNADFSAQTIPLNLSNYNAVYVEFSRYKTETVGDGEVFGIFVPVGHSGNALGDIGSSTNLVSVTRAATVTTSGVAFSVGKIRVQGSASSTSDRTSYMIPYRIYGIKF